MAHIAAADNTYRGRTPASLAAAADESLETIHAAGNELNSLGLLVVTPAPKGNNEFWDIYSLSMADFLEARMLPH